MPRPPVIRKGIYLSALIYIEGDQPAPEDFAALTISALKQVLNRCLQGEHDHQGLSMTLKRLEVRHDIEQNGEEEEGEEGREEKFQF
jgi:hypothetical protein